MAALSLFRRLASPRPSFPLRLSSVVAFQYFSSADAFSPYNQVSQCEGIVETQCSRLYDTLSCLLLSYRPMAWQMSMHPY